ncbi:zinc-binding dehydrogenase [Arthrobacter gyeryongensis]|uniref:Zinc-binding dehydrogenase n=1 Tax=Arthrobacter gyeryongensis TaxID=1650592 RepID=A0ABP8VA94_9MICC
MKAVILPGDKRVIVEERKIPDLGPHDVLVRTRASAICRSDMSLYHGSPIVGGEGARQGSVIPGHEAAGEVVRIGDSVTHVKEGDRVAGYLAVGCGFCEYCLSGYMMLCKQWKCLGFDVHGGDADYFVLPERNCLQLPDELSFRAGAVMTDMLGSQYHVQKQLGVAGGKTLAVFGMGPMGLAAVLVGKAFGARIIAVDVIANRLEQASRLGADVVINSGTDDALQRVRELTQGRGAEICIDCSGNPAGQNSALDAAAKLGAVALVGESRATEINPSEQIIRKLLTVVGGWYFPISDWEGIVRLVLDQKVPVEKLISHEFSINQAEEAFQAFDRRETEKALFIW